jgi:hypothetical protein
MEALDRLLLMSAEQQKNYNLGRIQPLGVGVFRCAYNGIEEDDDEKCDNASLWQAPLEDWWSPVCQECGHGAVLVEVLDAVRRCEKAAD